MCVIDDGEPAEFVNETEPRAARAELAHAVNAVECSYLFGSLLDDARHAISPDGDHWSAPPEKMGRLVGLVFREIERRAAA